MKKKEVEELLQKYLEGKTSVEDEQLLNRHTQDPYYLDEIGFYKEAKEQELPNTFDETITNSIKLLSKRSFIHLAPILKIAAVLLLVFLSVSLVRMNTTYNELLTKMEAIQSTLAVTLIDHRSVHLKLKALKFAEELPEIKPELSRSLIDLLNNDENVNVRMAVVETMAGFSENEYIKTEFIRSLKKQESFLVRAILVENLINMNDPAIIEEMTKMIEDDRTELELRNQIKEMIL